MHQSEVARCQVEHRGIRTEGDINLNSGEIVSGMLKRVGGNLDERLDPRRVVARFGLADYTDRRYR